MRAVTKDYESLKKRSTDEKSNARKQKDRDAERIRLLEYEKYEKDGEKDRIKGVFEERLREARNKEAKAEKERKQALLISNNTLERAKAAEVGQVRLMLKLLEQNFERTRKDIKIGVIEAEKCLRRYSLGVVLLPFQTIQYTS